MGMETELKKIENIWKRFPYMNYQRLLESYEKQKTGSLMIREVAVNGEEIQLLNIDNRMWLLNSTYNPTEAARVWVKQYEKDTKINNHSIFSILGMSDGRAIKELMKCTKFSAMIVYEPCEDIFWDAIGRELYGEILEDERIFLVIGGICEEAYPMLLKRMLDYSNFRRVICTALPNYDRIFLESYKRMLGEYRDAAEYVMAVRNTELQRAVESTQNAYKLTRDIIRQYNVGQMYHVIRRMGLEDVPAILVAAGPSLDKNIDYLKKAEGKSFLMVVDTALNTVLNHGIKPDMTITVDSRKPLRLFEHPDYAEVPIVLAAQSRYEAVKKNKARHYYELSTESYVGRIIQKKVKKEVEELESGGSVANSALAFLIEMGFKTVVFVGQDLAYPNGKTHAQDAYKGTEKNIDIQDSKYIQVEGNDGKPIWTEWNMNAYRKWIEQYILRYPNIRFINATEGGARIFGTEVCSLKDVIDTFCTREIDRRCFFVDQETFCTREEQELLLQEVRRIPDDLELLESDLKRLKELYIKLEGASRKKINDAFWLKPMLREISTITSRVEEKDVSVLIRPYMIDYSYAVEEEIYEYGSDDSIYAQVKDIVKQGKTLIKGYEQGILAFKQEMHELVGGE